MSPDEYIVDIKERFGDQSTKDGLLIRDLEDRDLLKRMLARYPGDRDKIIGIETLLSEDEMPATLPPTKTQSQLEQLTGGIARAFEQRRKNTQESRALTEAGDQTLVEGLGQAFGQGAGFIGDIGFEFIKSIVKPEVKDKIKGGIEAITSNDLVQGAAQKYQEFAEANPRAAKNLEATFNIATIIPGVGYGTKAVVKGVEEGAEAAAKVAKTAIPSVAGVADDAVDAGKQALQTAQNKIQTYYAKKGADPQVATSAERLQADRPLIGAGAARQKSLVEIYDEFATQEGKHLADIKQDPAIGIVGERIGDEFDKIVKMRRTAGENMETALKSVGKTRVQTPALSNFITELENSGTVRRSKTGLEFSPNQVSKFTSTDSNLLEWYLNELDKLGKDPTVAQLDAFVSRIPRDAKELLQKKNITQRTNAERIINENLNTLRKEFDRFADYKAARAEYANLSKFLEEGIGFLGKKTQSGDYAKDASIAKSAVQSVLNNGKKDWLVRLEELTGYPALDEATLALQAMKDAGDFKGNSLLELLADKGTAGIPPTSARGALLTALEAVWTAGKNKALGSPADQTRAFLKSVTDEKKNR